MSKDKTYISIDSRPAPYPKSIRIAKYILGENDFVDIPGRGRVGVTELAYLIEEGKEEAKRRNLLIDDYGR